LIRRLACTLALTLALALAATAGETPERKKGTMPELKPAPLRKLTPVPFTEVEIADVFWAPRMKVNREKTIPHEYKQCKDTGRIDAWKLQWKVGQEPVPHIFWDSDVAKWIEAAAYSLQTQYDPALDRQLDEVCSLIASAQQPDGYLNSHFIQVEPLMRWKNLGHWHELYCAGHLMEAAVAHYQATGKRTLLDALVKYADHIDSYFGPGKHDGAPGHPEIELALVKLYRTTGDSRYLALSKYFVDMRGRKPSVFEREMAGLTPQQQSGHKHFFVKKDGSFNTEYVQDHLPVREQSVPVGHAVRAMYLYSGMADVGAETGDPALLDACMRLWENLCTKRMYLTGGIGPAASNEGFTNDYDLPNDSAYCETCAAVALVFWNHRLLQLDADSRFADVMERCLYNGTISGLSLDGVKFFYENPLASDGKHHRQDWFGCACCPPNIARLIASVGGYAYSQAERDAYVHLYIQGQGNLKVGGKKVVLRQKTDYPWAGRVEIAVEPEAATAFGLNLRIPGWAREAKVAVNGEAVDLKPITRKGYARIEREWKAGDQVVLELPMPVERIEANPAVAADRGRVALQRGPVVFCLEAADNPTPLDQMILPRDSKLEAKYDKDLLNGVIVVSGEAQALDAAAWGKDLYRPSPMPRKRVPIKAIPYYAWDHRAPGEMRVWIQAE
jgi:hypothetical protein